jgi:Tfp pilus assembly protein PilF
MDLAQARAERKERRDQKKSLQSHKIEIESILINAHKLHQAGQLTEALPLYEKVIELGCSQADVFNNYGLVLKEVERWDEAIVNFHKAISLDGSHAAAFNNLGNVLSQLGNKYEAVDAYRNAVNLKPEFDQFLSNFGVALQDITEYEKAEQVFTKILKINPNFGSAYSNLATAQNSLGRTEEALANFKKRFNRERGDDLLIPNHKSFLTTSKSKMDHDIEQFHYLHNLGLTEKPFDKIAALYETIRDETYWPTGKEPLISLTQDQRRRIGATYNRAYYHPEAPALETSPINPNLDTDYITKAYFDGVNECKQVVTVDNLLTEEAITSLQKYLRESTIWYDIYRRGYLGAFLGEGLECGLLLQIANDLSKKFPTIFKDYKLNQLWANKYDSQLKGIGLHADFAAVNVNFWVTPDDANLNPENGGLVVYGHEAPLNWNFESYNRDEKKIRNYLTENKSPRTVIPYRCNRMGLFNSDLFHETDTINFKTGYENRRMNVTMLFGTRQTTHE